MLIVKKIWRDFWLPIKNEYLMWQDAALKTIKQGMMGSRAFCDGEIQQMS